MYRGILLLALCVATLPAEASSDSADGRVVIPSSAAAGDRFGAAVASAGEWFAISSPEAERPRSSGTIAVYRVTPCGPELVQADLAPPDSLGAIRFGARIAMTAETLVATSDDEKVHVFQLTDDTWRYLRTLSKPASPVQIYGNDDRHFGSDVAVARNMIVVGAPHNGRGSGAVYGFVHSPERTEFRGILALPPDRPRYGRLVALSPEGGLVLSDEDTGRLQLVFGFLGFDYVIGSYFLDRPLNSLSFGETAIAAGSMADERVHLFRLGAIPGTLEPFPPIEFEPVGTAPGSGFGASIALSQKRLLVGAPMAAEGAGALFEYAFDEAPDADADLPISLDFSAELAGVGASVALTENFKVGGAPQTANDRGSALALTSARAEPWLTCSADRRIEETLVVDPSDPCPGYYIGEVSAPG